MSSLRFVGLDTSLNATGVAAADGRCSTINAQKMVGMPAKLDVVINGVIQALRPCGADVAAVEKLVPGGQQGETMGKLGAARYIICWALWRDGIVIVDVQQAQLKKYATGKGNAAKEQVYDAAVAASNDGLEPRDDNQGDAFWLRQMAMANYAPLHEDLVEVSDEQASVLRLIRWPKLTAGMGSRS